MRLIFLLIFISLTYSCKQKTELVAKPEIDKSKQETRDKVQVSPIAKELLKFAEINLTDATYLSEVFLVKEINNAGNIKTINLKTGIELYKKALSSQKPETLPIFEIKNSNKTILLVNSKGYMGAIWALILVDKITLKIEKVQFDHKGESEGYGAEFTYSSFENMFTGATILFTENTFALKQNDKNVVKGNQKIDGISGATITSKAAVNMLNEGLQQYQKYLR